MNIKIWDHKPYIPAAVSTHPNGIWTCCGTDHTRPAGMTAADRSALLALHPCSQEWDETAAHPARTLIFGIAGTNGKA